jgi:hypothetical protein
MELPNKVFAVVYKDQDMEQEGTAICFAKDDDDVKRQFGNAEIEEYVELKPLKAIANKNIEQRRQHDEVNSPSHYCKGGIECIDVIKVCTEGLVGMEAVCTANIIKYIFRWKDKNGLTDVKKCKWYVERLIKEKENESQNRE